MAARNCLRRAAAARAPTASSRNYTVDRSSRSWPLALPLVALLAFALAPGAHGAEVDPNPPLLTLPTFLASSMVLQRAPGRAPSRTLFSYVAAAPPQSTYERAKVWCLCTHASLVSINAPSPPSPSPVFLASSMVLQRAQGRAPVTRSIKARRPANSSLLTPSESQVPLYTRLTRRRLSFSFLTPVARSRAFMPHASRLAPHSSLLPHHPTYVSRLFTIHLRASSGRWSLLMTLHSTDQTYTD